MARELAAEPQSVPEVATDLPPSRSSCEPYRSFIEAEAAKGRNAVAIYQDLVEHHGYDGAYNAVKRFVGKLRPAQPKVSCRFETDPGQEAQVDYGEGAFTRHPQTGKYRRPRLFVMKLSNSRRALRRVRLGIVERDLGQAARRRIREVRWRPAYDPTRQS
jgi:hypothetical protein